MRDTILVRFRSRLAGEESRELFVEVDQVPRVFPAFEFVLCGRTNGNSVRDR